MHLHEQIKVIILIAEVVIRLPADKFLYRLIISIGFKFLFIRDFCCFWLFIFRLFVLVRIQAL